MGIDYDRSLDILKDLNAVFASEVARKPTSSRWIVSPSKPPHRQKPLSARTHQRHPEQMYRRNDGAYVLDREGVQKEILTLDVLPERLMREWNSRGLGVSKSIFKARFLSRYAGVIMDDMDFLFRKMDAIRDEVEMKNRQRLAEELRASEQAEIERMKAALALQGLFQSHHQPVTSKDSAVHMNVPQAMRLSAAKANKQQADLFSDPRRDALLDSFSRNASTDSKSHLSRLGQLAFHILSPKNGRPARAWTTECSATSMADADYLLLTEEEHERFAAAGDVLKPIVVRCEKFRARRNATTRDKVFDELLNQPRWRRVHVQRLNKKYTESIVETVKVPEVIQAWHNSPADFSDQYPPMNLLNLSNHREGVWLTGLCKEYQMLNDACAFSDEESLFHQKNLEQANVGKEGVTMWTASDIKNCKEFMILAQRGAVSSWHVDNIGVWTWVTLEGNRNDPNEKDTDVLKYWPVFPMDSLTSAQRSEAWEAFGEEKVDWRPTPACKIPVISLIKGDTLIMPPGTIHAPITVTDCLFVGGMCMHPQRIKTAISVWLFLVRNPACTNEPPPRQTRSILDYIHNRVHNHPEAYGYSREELAQFDMDCEEISMKSLSCRCSGGCEKTSCGCLRYGQRCGAGCHQPGECNNPFGCHVKKEESWTCSKLFAV